MAKRSQWQAVLDHAQRLKKYFKIHGRQLAAPGFGESFAFNRCSCEAGIALPVSPPTAYFLRRYVSAYDALRHLRAETPALAPNLETVSRSREMIPFWREAIGEMLEALGPRRNDFKAGLDRAAKWVRRARKEAGIAGREALSLKHPDPRVRVAAQVEMYVVPLVIAYEDPRGFFRTIAPKIDSNSLFDPMRIGPFPDDGVFHFSQLGKTLHTWGFGALLNPTARRAFDWASRDPERLRRILAEAEGRDAYREGVPVGKTRGFPKPGRPRKLAGDLRAGSLEKRILRSGIRKRQK